MENKDPIFVCLITSNKNKTVKTKSIKCVFGDLKVCDWQEVAWKWPMKAQNLKPLIKPYCFPFHTGMRKDFHQNA